jgi:hypothetical protein
VWDAGDNLRHIASVDTGSIQPALDDFPRYHPRTAARCRSGFTDISRYGLVFTYPTRNFATLGPFIVLRLQAHAWSGRIGYRLSWSPMRSDYLIPSTRRVRRIVSEDSLHGVSALATSIERFSNLENLPTRFVGEWRLSQYRYRIREHFKVSLLSPNQWEPAEERNHAGVCLEAC